MLGCEVLYGRDKGAEVRALVERAIDGPCPCMLGLTCPLLSQSQGAPMRVSSQRSIDCIVGPNTSDAASAAAC